MTILDEKHRVTVIPESPYDPENPAPEELSRIRDQSGSRPSAVAAGLRTVRSRSDRRISRADNAGSPPMRLRASAAIGRRHALSSAWMLEAPIACSRPNPERARRGAPHPAITITARQDERLAGLTGMSPPGMNTLPSRCGPPTAAALRLRSAIRDQTSDARGAFRRRGHARRMPMQAIIIRALIGEVRVRSASRAPQARAACRRGRAGRAAHTSSSRLRWRLGVALGFVWCGAMGDLRARCGSERLRAYSRRRCHAQVRCRRLLGLERLERARRAPELGHGRAAIAVGRSAPTNKVEAGSRQPSRIYRALLPSRIRASPSAPCAPCRSSNNSVCWRPSSGMGPQPRFGGQPIRRREHGMWANRDACASTVCSAPTGCSSSIEQRRLERGELGGILVRSSTCFCARMPCLRAFCAERALPSGVFRPARPVARSCGSPRRGHC